MTPRDGISARRQSEIEVLLANPCQWVIRWIWTATVAATSTALAAMPDQDLVPILMAVHYHLDYHDVTLLLGRSEAAVLSSIRTGLHATACAQKAIAAAERVPQTPVDVAPAGHRA